MRSSRRFSARFDSDVVNRLERRVDAAGVNRSRLAERYIDERMRMDDHPGVVLRDGPTGRRAGLAAGPDVWEVIAAIRQSGLTGDAALAAAAEWGGLTPIQIRAALGYYAEYPEGDRCVGLPRDRGGRRGRGALAPRRERPGLRVPLDEVLPASVAEQLRARGTTSPRSWNGASSVDWPTVLARHLDPGVVVLHDRRIPHSRANVDHIAVAPSGVWVIDAKRHQGKVAISRPCSAKPS